MSSTPKSPLPLVYSCSGCSSAAQMANALAIRADREGVAEMSCVAGLGGDVESLVKTARSGRKIAVLDGCPLTCARKCVARHQITIDAHFILSDFGVRKVQHADFSQKEAEEVYEGVKAALSRLTAHPRSLV